MLAFEFAAMLKKVNITNKAKSAQLKLNIDLPLLRSVINYKTAKIAIIIKDYVKDYIYLLQTKTPIEMTLNHRCKTIFVLTAFLAITFTSFAQTGKALQTIIVDAGHGIMANGGHNGAKGAYSYEDEICLAISPGT